MFCLIFLCILKKEKKGNPSNLNFLDPTVFTRKIFGLLLEIFWNALREMAHFPRTLMRAGEVKVSLHSWDAWMVQQIAVTREAVCERGTRNH